MTLPTFPTLSAPGGLKLRRTFLASALTTLALLAACATSNKLTTSTSTSAAPQPLSAERIAAVLASPDRSAADLRNDIRRKPDLMLAFIGVRPGMSVLDLSAGGGYTTELLARAVGSSGRVYGQNAPRDPASPPRQPVVPEGNVAPPNAPDISSAGAATAAMPARQTLAERAKNPAVNIVALIRKFEDPLPADVSAQSLDLATLMFNYHDLGYQGVDRMQMNKAVFKALKTGGIYVIADHAGRAGTGISEAATLHRMEEAFLRKEVEAAGFKQVASGDFLRNPADPRDKNTPEPAQPKDEFVLKFMKP